MATQKLHNLNNHLNINFIIPLNYFDKNNYVELNSSLTVLLT